MGAKAPSKLGLRRPTYKCSVCSKKFLSVQALKSHQYCVHKIKEEKKPNKDKAKTSSVKVKSEVVVHKESQPPELKKDIEIPVDSANSSNRKVELECPICHRTYSMSSSFKKHIQDYHSEGNDSKNETKPSSIKPIQVEVCLKCNTRTLVEKVHDCRTFNVPLDVCYVCTGCSQTFNSPQLFDIHVSGLHSDQIESMFFPTLEEFHNWKEEMELDTKIKYENCGRSDKRVFFRCTAQLPEESNSIYYYLCPSTIVIREYSKGIQIHFYKQHYGHSGKLYHLPEGYKKFSIASVMKEKKKLYGLDDEDDISDDEGDLYIQFKKLMETIVVDAAKLNINSLKELISKALEMSNCLKMYDEDSGTLLKPMHTNKRMTDSEITTALEAFQNSLKAKRSKNKIENNNEIESEVMSQVPMILNTFSLAGEEETKPESKSSKVSKIEDNSTVHDPTKSSFNNSYEKFVNKKFKLKSLKDSILKKNQKAKLANATSKVSTLSKKLFKNDLVENMPNSMNTKMAKLKTQTSNLVKTNVKKKIVKTKIGQFKPSLSPRKTEKVEKEDFPDTSSNSSEKLRNSVGTEKVKLELDYEVKEQDNDCNILILKI